MQSNAERILLCVNSNPISSDYVKPMKRSTQDLLFGNRSRKTGKKWNGKCLVVLCFSSLVLASVDKLTLIIFLTESHSAQALFFFYFIRYTIRCIERSTHPTEPRGS